MKLAAIYIEEHQYLFDKPQTINFGSYYNYSFESRNGEIAIRRSNNEHYIDGFFDKTALRTALTNVNAIVGHNGAGKSSVLDIIRACFVDNSNSLPYSKCLVLAEDNDNQTVLVRNDFSGAVVLNEEQDSEIEDIDLHRIPVPQKLQSIYYSPHFDYKHNPNFDSIDDHDKSY